MAAFNIHDKDLVNVKDKVVIITGKSALCENEPKCTQTC